MATIIQNAGGDFFGDIFFAFFRNRATTPDFTRTGFNGSEFVLTNTADPTLSIRITGGALALNADDDIIAGTVTGLFFRRNGVEAASVTGLSIDGPTFSAALNDFNAGGNDAAFDPILDTLDFDYALLSADGGSFAGRLGPDTITGGAGDDTIGGSPGDDDIDGAFGTDVIDYSALGGPVAVNIGNATSLGLSPGLADKGDDGTDTLANFNAVIGTAGNDTLTARGVADATLIGGSGDDNIDITSIGPGAGTVIGGAGNDTLSAGGTTDRGTLSYQNDSDTLSGAPIQGVNLTFTSASAGTAIDPYGDTDTFNSVGAVIGSELGDTLVGGTAADALFGAGGDDFIDAGDDGDLSNPDTVDGGAGNDTLQGGFGVDILRGGDGNDLIFGDIPSFDGFGGGSDFLFGDAGDDTLVGGSQFDEFEGGDGFDIIDASQEGGGLSVNVNLANSRIIRDSFGTSNEPIAGIEGVIGTALGDTLTGDGFDNLLDGRDGADSLFGFDGADTLIGGAGDDTIASRGGDDIIDTGDGVDLVQVVSGDGNDSILPDADATNTAELPGFVPADINSVVIDGADLVVDFGPFGQSLRFVGAVATGGPATIVNEFGQLVFGNAETRSLAQLLTLADIDRLIEGDDLSNTLVGGAGNDTIRGFGAPDTLQGEGGDDLLDGGAGADFIDGGAGLDTLTYADDPSGVFADLQTRTFVDGSGANDSVFNVEGLIGSEFDDTLAGSNVFASTIQGLGGNDVISAGDDGDLLDGGAGVDFLTGDGGNDTLRGGIGDDLLFGSFGDDLMDGGDGGGDSVLYGSIGLSGGVIVNNRPTAAGGAAPFTVQKGGPFFVDTLSGIEGINASEFADSIFVDGDFVFDRAGDDFVSSLGDALFIGGSGNDTYEGGAGSRLDYGDDGNDTAGPATQGIDATFTSATGGTVLDPFGDADSFTGVDAISGTDFGDRIVAGIGNQRLEGRGGDDFIDGGADDDDLFGDAGNDTLLGGAGRRDELAGGAGNDILDGGDGSADEVRYDREDGTGNVFVDLVNGIATDTFGDADTLIGIERARGGAGDDTLIGDERNNGLRGLSGSDSLDGAGGFDFVSFFQATESVNVDLTAERAFNDGFGFEDTLVSFENVTGGRFDDTILGTNDSNFFEGFDGADLIDGRGGDDFVSFSFEIEEGGAQGVVVDLDAGTAIDAFGNADTLISIEHVEGSAFGDVILGGAFDANDIAGFAGNDTLDGGAGDDDELRYDREDGTQGVDVNLATGVAIDTFGDTDQVSGFERVSGTRFDDTLTGGLAEETFLPGGGNDRVTGGDGAGNDRVGYFTDGDAIRPLDVDLATGVALDPFGGTDTLVGIEWVFGSDQNDTLRGDAFDNALEGGPGDDLIDGRDGFDIAFYGFDGSGGVAADLAAGTAADDAGGSDTLISIEGVRASSQNDTLFGDDGDNFFIGGAGNDLIDGRLGEDVVSFEFDNILPGVDPSVEAGVTVNLAGQTAIDGFGGSDTLIGIEAVTGSAFGDDLSGDGEANRLRGLGGDDIIRGGGGDDTLNGGDGADVLIADDDSGAPAPFADQLIGGAGGDEFNADRLDSLRYDLEGGGGGIVADLTARANQTILDSFGDTDTLVGDAVVVGTSQADTFTSGAFGGVFAPGLGADAITLGLGTDRIEGTVAELDGDRLSGFDDASGDTFRVLDANGDPVEARMVADGSVLTIDTDLDGVAEATLTLLDGYAGPVRNFDFDSANGDPTADPIGPLTALETDAPVAIDLLADANAFDPDGDLLSAANVAVTSPAGPVAFDLAGNVLTIAPFQFAEDIAAGESVLIDVAYNVVDGFGGVTANTASLTVNGVDGPFTFFRDADLDRFGVDDPLTNLRGFTAPSGFADVAGDADDADPTIFPGAPEINDRKDNDQDGLTDEDNRAPAVATIDAGSRFETAAPVTINLRDPAFVSDPDGDALTISGVTVAAGGGAPVAFSRSGDAITIDPGQFADALDAGQTETVTIDYVVADGFGGASPNQATLAVRGLDGPFTFFIDRDRDGFGVDDAATNIRSNAAPSGFVATAGDADDRDAAVFPGAREVNDRKDNDQDGLIDETNRAPVARDAAFVALANQPLSIAVGALLGAATDADGDALSARLAGGVFGGTAARRGDSFVFTPRPGFSGEAGFDFAVSDGFGGVDVASVAIDLLGVNPVVAAPNQRMLQGTAADDLMIAGTGRNLRMVGGEGEDVFVFGLAAGDGVRDSAVILDFTPGEDMIDIGGRGFVQLGWRDRKIILEGGDGDSLTLANIDRVDLDDFVDLFGAA